MAILNLEDMDKQINIVSAANYMIDVSKFSLTNLRLNKLMYYVYGLSIVNGLKFNEKPQAWDYGPVFPSIYHAFKLYGLNKINKLAKGCRELENEEMKENIESVYGKLKHREDWELVNVSHVKGGPWEKTYREGIKYLEIPDESIKEYFIKNFLKDA